MRFAPYVIALLTVGCGQTTPKESLVKVTPGPSTSLVYCLTVDDPQKKLHSQYCDLLVNGSGLDQIYMEEEVNGKGINAAFHLGELIFLPDKRSRKPHRVIILERNSKDAQDFIANYEYYKNFLPKK